MQPEVELQMALSATKLLIPRQ